MLTAVIQLQGSNFQNSLAIKLDLLLAVGLEGADNVAEVGRDRAVVVVACRQRGSLDGKAEGSVAEESHHEGIEQNEKLHIE